MAWRMQHELFCAIDDKKDVSEVMRLLKKTKKPGEITFLNQLTLLHYAAMHGRTDVCRLLIEKYKVDPHMEDIDGFTALNYARVNHHTNTVEYLETHSYRDLYHADTTIHFLRPQQAGQLTIEYFNLLHAAITL